MCEDRRLSLCSQNVQESEECLVMQEARVLRDAQYSGKCSPETDNRDACSAHSSLFANTRLPQKRVRRANGSSVCSLRNDCTDALWVIGVSNQGSPSVVYRGSLSTDTHLGDSSGSNGGISQQEALTIGIGKHVTDPFKLPPWHLHFSGQPHGSLSGRISLLQSSKFGS
jgi:hypothetical protein